MFQVEAIWNIHFREKNGIGFNPGMQLASWESLGTRIAHKYFEHVCGFWYMNVHNFYPCIYQKKNVRIKVIGMGMQNFHISSPSRGYKTLIWRKDLRSIQPNIEIESLS